MNSDMSTTVLDHDFLKYLADIHDHASRGHQPPRLKWYLTTIIAFGGMNYPELIPELYQILLKEHIPQEDQMQETRKIREGLTRVCGIWGAAKVGVYLICRCFLNSASSSLTKTPRADW